VVTNQSTNAIDTAIAANRLSSPEISDKCTSNETENLTDNSISKRRPHAQKIIKYGDIIRLLTMTQAQVGLAMSTPKGNCGHELVVFSDNLDEPLPFAPFTKFTVLDNKGTRITDSNGNSSVKIGDTITLYSAATDSYLGICNGNNLLVQSMNMTSSSLWKITRPNNNHISDLTNNSTILLENSLSTREHPLYCTLSNDKIIASTIATPFIITAA
jgi:hypothetical protein